MNYLNLNLIDLRDPAFAAASQIERGIWLGLLLHCVAKENGGVISGANDWNERKWLLTCGIEWDVAPIDSELWTWNGDDLHVWGYPHTAQHSVNAKREAGKKGGRPSSKSSGSNAENHMVFHTESSCFPAGNLKGKERNGMEGKEMENGRSESGQNAADFQLSADVEDDESEVPGTSKLSWSPETGWQGVTAELIGDLGEAYPACHIRRQFLAMEQWLLSNPAKARKSNWRRFVTNWLKGEQDKGGDLRSEPRASGSQGFGPKKIEGGGRLAEQAPAVVSEPEFDWRAGHVRLYGVEAPVRRWAELPKSVRYELRQEAEKNEGKGVAA